MFIDRGILLSLPRFPPDRKSSGMREANLSGLHSDCAAHHPVQSLRIPDHAASHRNGGRSERSRRASPQPLFAGIDIRRPQSIDRWFGTADTICLTAGVNDGKCVYGVPGAASFGNSGKATERAPSLFSLDLNLSKRFHITEAKYVLLRSDFYNLPNHPAFSPPARNISTASTFGAITGASIGSRTIELALKLYF